MFLKEVSHQGCIYFASKNSIIVKYYQNEKLFSIVIYLYVLAEFSASLL